ncbi:hypothetical protein B0I32_103628 [Nonomuraea fuscirosea]|uniref:Uncharacterized protein n=1 Tax=Nonomuraea fuscirosea TaxID=1291556 RepID=A0A2T0N7W4_9ACTN|nr:hypothetical protein [Nonomuraea fuscirosea]PRX68666.1 hypothetical protein B0I32_103628 [Nonomuraea fuscirosea]
MNGYTPQPSAPEPRGSWFSRLSSFQQIMLSFSVVFVVLGLAAVVVFAVAIPERPQARLLTDQEIEELRKELPPTFTRQEDGGQFDSPQQLVETLATFDIECGNAYYYISTTKDQVVKCWTGQGTVLFIVARPGDTEFRYRLSSDQAVQALNSLYLFGRNWALSTACDADYGNRVRRAIGGEFLRAQYMKPTDC